MFGVCVYTMRMLGNSIAVFALVVAVANVVVVVVAADDGVNATRAMSRGELTFVNVEPRGSGFFPGPLTNEPRVLTTDVFLPPGVHLENASGLPVIVYAHGFDSNPDENAAFLASVATETDFVVYAPRSPGEGFNFKERASDLVAVLREVAAHGEPAYLLGFSLGAASVLRAIEAVGTDVTLPRLRGVLAFSPPGNLLQFMDFSHAGDIAVTVIVGTNDRSTPISRIERFVTAPYGSLARLENFNFFIVPGAKHTGWMTVPDTQDPETFDILVCLKTEPESHCRGLEFEVQTLENDVQQQLMLVLATRIMELRPVGDDDDTAAVNEGGGVLRSCSSSNASSLKFKDTGAEDVHGDDDHDADETHVPQNPCRPTPDAEGFCFALHEAWFPEQECMRPCCVDAHHEAVVADEVDDNEDDDAGEAASASWSPAGALLNSFLQWAADP